MQLGGDECPLLGVYHTLSYHVGKTQLETENEMTDQEKIELLSEALNNLLQSTQNVPSYIEDDMAVDIDNARAVLQQIPPKSWNL